MQDMFRRDTAAGGGEGVRQTGKAICTSTLVQLQLRLQLTSLLLRTGLSAAAVTK